jgi:hypothetical protein
MVKLCIIASLFFAIFLANAQQVKNVTGLVIYNGERLNSADVKNISLNRHAITDDKGQFIIVAKSGDTLITSKEYYTNDTLLVSGDQDVVIQLRKNPLQLKEVVINAKTITPASAFEANKKEYKDIYFKGDDSNIFGVEAGTMPGLTVNIDKVYNALSKQGKDARRMQRTLIRDYKNNVVDKRFNPLAAKVTGYKGKRLNDFIAGNRPSYEMVAKATDYDITEYIKGKLSKEGTE